VDAIAQAFTLFQQLRDQRTCLCDYRHSELAPFRMAVESLDVAAAGADRPRKRKKPDRPDSSNAPDPARPT
jgi:hypothetical protein